MFTSEHVHAETVPLEACTTACGFGRVSTCELDRIAEEVSLDEAIRTQAVSICSSMFQMKSTKLRSIPVVAASSIYVACRINCVPLTLKELARASHTTPWDLGRSYTSILEKMGVKPPNPNGGRYVLKVASKMRASEDVTRLSQDLEDGAIRAGLAGRNPMSLAAAAVYSASLAKGEPVTQLDVAEVAGVSVASLRESARRMRKLLEKRKTGPL